MSRLITFFILCLCQQAACAAIYKCQSDGKTEYQAIPCAHAPAATGKTVKVDPTPAADTSAVPDGKRPCIGKELRINFTNMPVKSVLQVLADFSGNKLVADASITGSAAFNYECVAWDKVLQDIATRHNLNAKVENGSIVASKR